MRSALKLDGITDVETDIGERVCSFKVDHGAIDLTAKLNDLSKTNDHIAGWSLLEQEDVSEVQ